MPAATQAPPSGRRAPSHPLYLNEGLSPKKTAFIIVTVIGCIAILWPKVFHPMMFGGVAPKPGPKEQRGPGGLRQERPAHLHPESIYQAMRERGRAIPATPTVPIVDRKASPSNPPPRIVEGRPGPIPGMRPPMGAGSVHQPQAKGSSMGFIMPLYTIGIIVFFMYTIMKIVFKKPLPNAPYGPAPTDPNFRKEVFGPENNGRHVEDLNSSKLGSNLHPEQRNGSELYNASLSAATVATNLSSSLKQQHHQYPSQQQQQQQQEHQQYQQQQQQQSIATGSPSKAMGPMGKLFNKETEQLMEIEKLRRKLEDTEKAMAKLIAEMNSDQYEAKEPNENTNTKESNISNGHTSELREEDIEKPQHAEEAQRKSEKEDHKDLQQQQQRKRREGSADRSVAILGMEVTASCEGGQKWIGRPPTPVYHAHNEHSSDVDMPEPQSIYLEGSLAHESQILVSDAETRTEEVYDEELNGSAEEPAVVLSSKMTLSLINLDSNQGNDSAQNNNKNDIESPLADDIEIIGHDEK